MAGGADKANFNQIPLKYKNVEAFKKAAETTFNKGRMTLKSKKDLQEGERIILVIKFKTNDRTIRIVSEIIQKIPAEEEGKPNTYGIRWLNFTAKKLKKFLEETGSQNSGAQEQQSQTPEPPPPPPKPEPPPPPEPPTQKAEPEPQPETPPPPAEDKTGEPGPASEEPIAAPPPEDTEEPAGTTDISGETETPQPPSEEPESRSEPETAQTEEKSAPLPPDQPAPSMEEAFSSSGEGGGGGELDLLSALDEEPASKPSPVKTEAPPEEPESDVDTSDEVQPVPAEPEAPPPERPEEASPAGEQETEAGPSGNADEAPPGGEQATAASEITDLESGAGEDDFDLTAALEEESPPPPSESEEETPEAIAPTAEAPAEETEADSYQEEEPPAAGKETVEQEAPEEAEPAPPSAEGPQEAAEEDKEEEKEPGIESAEPAAGPPAPEPSESKRMSSQELSALASLLTRLSRYALQPESAEAPENEQALQSLYNEFKSVMNNHDEIILHVRSRGPTREFMLGGDVAEPVNLKNSLGAEEFDELAVKLVEFFNAKGFTGLQLRRYLSEDAFVSLVRTLASYDPEEQTAEDLGASLISKGVFHATPVHESERVVSDPTLDFRVDMTLSRLCGEIRRLKYLADAMQEDPDAVWTLRVEDALKALPEGSLLAEVLLRAEDVVSGQEEIDSSVLAQEMLLATPVETLAGAGRHLCLLYEDRYLSAGQSEEDKQYLEKIQKTLRQVSARLVVEDPDAAADIMGDLYRRGVFALDELPPELRERMMVEQFVDSFLEDPDKRLADFQNIQKPKDYRAAARRYVLMIAELLRKQKVEEADRIFRTLLEHWKSPAEDFPERTEIAGEALQLLGRADCIKVLVNSLTDPDKAHREKVAAMIYAAVPEAAPALMDQLSRTEDRNVRRLICEILVRFGPPVADLIKERALEPRIPWYLLRNLIMVLGDMKSEVLIEHLDKFASHEHYRVREEAIVYAAKAMGTESEPWLVKALSDTEPLVYRRAAGLLSRFPQLSQEAVQGLADVLVRKPEGEPSPETEQAVELAAKVLAKMGNINIEEKKTLEDLVIESLEADSSKGFFGKLTGAKSRRTPKMRLALVQVLAEAGTKKSRKLLTTLSKDKDQSIKEIARQALEKIGG
ncbi:MAG: hypothetical protein R6V10_09720 [bacterium]